MTVSSALNRKEYAGDDSTTEFSTSPVVFFTSADLDVYVVDEDGVATLKTITTHYTVAGGDGSTGTVTMLTAPATGETLVIVRTLDITQATDLVNNDGSDAEVLEDALDKLTMLAQQNAARIDRSIHLADSDASGASTELPVPEASKLLGWDDDGLAIINYASASITDSIIPTAYMETLLDDSSAPNARVTLGFPDIAAKGDLIVGSADDTLVKLAVGTNGYSPHSVSGATSGLAYLPPPVSLGLINGYLDWTVSGNALTVSVKTLAGSDPSSTDPVLYWVRNGTTPGAASPLLVTLTSATSVTIPDTASMGTSNGVAFRLWAVLTGPTTKQLALINCRAGATPNFSIYPLGAWVTNSPIVQVSTGADSAHVFYATATDNNSAYAIAGYATWESGLATAGTWSAVPTREQAFDGNVALPGAVIQTVREQTGEVATGTDVTVNDDSIPQITEGDEYIDVSITPSSAANLLRHRAQCHLASSAGLLMHIHMHIDTTADAFAASQFRSDVVDQCVPGIIEGVTQAAGTVAQVTNLLAGATVAGTRTFNGASAARLLGGSMASFLEVEEIMT